jgi:signal transduction histidine kinase
MQPQFEDLVIREQPVQAKPAPAPTPAPAKQVQASYLTHELRAPVTAIRLGLEILQEQTVNKLASEERQMLDLAIRNTTRLEGLVKDILDHAKLVAGKVELDKTLWDPRELVSDAVDALQPTALAKGVKLSKEVETVLPRVSADGRRVVQVLTNLISNAIKFTPNRGRVVVSVKEGKFEHEGTLVFRVKDNGCGIDAKDLGEVFDMFTQAGSAQKKCEGTGLGLTLSKEFVKLHGGRIRAESWKGAGSSFYFTIPIAKEDLVKPVKVYPKPVEYHGMLVSLYRRMNAVLALFV